jgi:CheY-like chemotaxis protein
MLLLVQQLKRGGYEPVFMRVDTPEAMKKELEKHEWDIVISDYVMPRFSGLAALTILKESMLDLPFIIVSGKIGEEIAVDAMKAGAHDYIMKDKVERLVPAVERELREAEVRRRRRYAECRLGKTNRSLRMTVRCNRVLLHATEESAFLHEICRIIVGDGGYLMAWIGLAEETGGKRVRPAAFAGHEAGFLNAVEITWGDNESGCNPTGTAIRTGNVCIQNNTVTDPAPGPWRQEAINRGYESCIALPFIFDQRPFGALVIFSSERDAFTDEEKELLQELSDDVAFGVMTLKMRKKSKCRKKR